MEESKKKKTSWLYQADFGNLQYQNQNMSIESKHSIVIKTYMTLWKNNPQINMILIRNKS